MARMHEDEIEVDQALVSRLLTAQFPRLAELPLRPVEPAGTDNAIYRLGLDMAVRLPRIGWAADQPEKEYRWLPRLAPHLSLAIPEPLGLGKPSEEYPFGWLVCTWLPGENAIPDRLRKPADDLAGLLHELWRIDPFGGPPAEGRGGPLAPRDDDCRRSIAVIADTLDAPRLLAEWKAALAAPEWPGPPRWLHGDLDARNLLATDGHLSGLLDFASIAVGDPAADVMVVWKMLDEAARLGFREQIHVDDATWLRARGWLLSQAVMILAYYTLDTNPTLVREARSWLTELLADPLPMP
jgi:aminoglycoside phosphotransferase (APT) family kinase protein